MTDVSVLCGISCQLGEGPTYDPICGKLFWFDINKAVLLEKSWPDGETIAHQLPEMASALAVIDESRQLLVAENGLAIRDSVTGRVTPHLAVDDNPAIRSNDSRVHPSGALWFSTMGKQEEKRVGAIYWYFRGEVRRLYDAMTIPNSICFSPDGAIAYFTDTDINRLMRVGCDPLTGLPMTEPAVLIGDSARTGFLDGSVVDAEGVLWNARWGAASLDAYAPDGSLLRSIAMPAGQTSCPAFAGPAADRLVVTSAAKNLDAAQLAADPLAGQTFLLDLAVRGRFEPRVAL